MNTATPTRIHELVIDGLDWAELLMHTLFLASSLKV